MQIVDAAGAGLTEEAAAPYTLLGKLPNGWICGAHRLLMHWTMHIGITEDSIEDRYCFKTKELAEAAVRDWNGEGDPDGWHRHVSSGRRRDPATGREWVAP